VEITSPAMAPLSSSRDRLVARRGGVVAAVAVGRAGGGTGAMLDRRRVVEMRGAAGSGRWRELAAHCRSAEDAVRLRRAARAAGASLNELVLGDVQVALGVWLQRHGPVRPRRIGREALASMNVGGARVTSESSTNALRRGPDRRSRCDRWGDGRGCSTARTRTWSSSSGGGLMRVFGALMRLRGWVPGGIARCCGRSGARSTLVFSNIGKLGAGGLVRSDGVLTLPARS